MSAGPRTAAGIARRAKRANARKAEKRAQCSHPVLDSKSLDLVRNLQDPGPSILTTYDDIPDRSQYRRDPDRQAAIEAHARRVAAHRKERV